MLLGQNKVHRGTPTTLISDSGLNQQKRCQHAGRKPARFTAWYFGASAMEIYKFNRVTRGDDQRGKDVNARHKGRA
jgi:hypothetical protein